MFLRRKRYVHQFSTCLKTIFYTIFFTKGHEHGETVVRLANQMSVNAVTLLGLLFYQSANEEQKQLLEDLGRTPVEGLPAEGAARLERTLNLVEDNALFTLDRKLASRLIRGLDVNNMGIISSEGRSVGIYPLASRINHSCSPNVYAYHALDKGAIVYHAIRPIKKGDELCAMYSQHWMFRS